MAKRTEQTETVKALKYISPIDPKRFSTSANVVISASIDSARTQRGLRRYKTGFTEEEYNSLFDGKMKDLTGKDYRKWCDTFQMNLSHATRVLDLSDPIDYFTYQTIRYSKKVLDGEAEKGSKREAIFMITDPQEQAKRAETKYTAIQEAAILLGQLSPSDKREMLYLYGRTPTNMNDTEVNAGLMTSVFAGQADAEKFIRFMKDPMRAQRILVHKAFNMGVIKKGSDGYYYDKLNLGPTLDVVIGQLEEPGFVTTKAALIKELG